MKTRTLASLALIGISLSLYGQGEQNLTADQQAFYQMLKPDAQQQFLELDDQHKNTAMDIYHSYCKGENECKGHREEAVQEQYNNQTQQRSKLNNGMK